MNRKTRKADELLLNSSLISCDVDDAQMITTTINPDINLIAANAIGQIWEITRKLIKYTNASKTTFMRM
jgi:hypothetical protein